MKKVYDPWQHEWNKFGKLKNSHDLNTYFQIDREFRHTYFFHYTSCKVIQSVFENGQIWISNVSGFNDKNDRNQFKNANEDNSTYFFSLCFSTGVNENLPLWYMYSGMDGQGGRLGIKKSDIKSFIGIDGNVNYTLWEVGRDDTGKPILKPNTDIVMKRDVDFSIQFKDVLYFRENDEKGTVDIKYNTMTNYNINKFDFDDYRKDRLGFFKSLVWYYEKETRLLIELVGDLRKKIDNTKTYVVTLDVDKRILERVSVTFAPEIKDSNRIMTETSLKKLYPNLDVRKSQYHDTIEMHFCNKCPRLANTI